MFNPTVKEFLKEKEDITLIGLYWAGYWRLTLIIMAGYLAFWFFAMIFVFTLGSL
jgi:hypothetical protein